LKGRRIDKTLTDKARALRNAPTPQERAIWRLLSRYRPKFTRQLSNDPFIADLACRAAKLIVEIDGSQHLDRPRDSTRTRRLKEEGWTVIRFWNSEVDENPEGVAQAILLKAAECLGGTHPPTPPFQGGEKAAAALSIGSIVVKCGEARPLGGRAAAFALFRRAPLP
jgi:very-short-patch-repair endonuclease